MQAIVLQNNNELRETVAKCSSIETLLFELLEARYDLTIGSFVKEAGPGVQIYAKRSPFFSSLKKPDCKPDIQTYIIHIPGESIKRYKFEPIPQKFEKFADKKGYVVNEEYFTKRDKIIGPRYDRWLEGYLIRPSALVNLILSYASVRMATVQLSKGLEHIQRGVVYCIRANCQFAPLTQKAYMQEILYVDFEKFEKLIRKRASKSAALAN
jgi:hypothetical protein